jgi:hypothetical protein
MEYKASPFTRSVSVGLLIAAILFSLWSVMVILDRAHPPFAYFSNTYVEVDGDVLLSVSLVAGVLSVCAGLVSLVGLLIARTSPTRQRTQKKLLLPALMLGVNIILLLTLMSANANCVVPPGWNEGNNSMCVLATPGADIPRMP